MWAMRELRAQVSRLGLALGVLAAGVVALGTGLPMVDGGARLAAPARAHSSSPVALQNALIGSWEGWLLVGVAGLILLALVSYRAAGRAKTIVALLVVVLGLTVQGASHRFAESDLLNYCRFVPAALCAAANPPGQLTPHIGELPPGYGFEVVQLGASGAVFAGLLLLIPASAPRPRRRKFAGREAVVWL